MSGPALGDAVEHTEPGGPRLPERIGRYRIIRPLSKGGMALVYEARRESLAGVAPRVAIKLILPDYAASETFRELFINEARLGAAMQHQNLVQIQDFDCDGDQYFLVMEYVEGITLSRVVSLCARNNVPIPLGFIAEIGRQACDGLHYAHGARDPQGKPLGLVHRDVKPSNLILNAQGVIKILDFGISKGALRPEKKGSIKGTWGYMAPEQATGRDVGPTADIFGLAVVLYEMAARRPMFKGREQEEIRRLLMEDHPARMVATLDSMYSPLISVLMRAVQRDPGQRYRDAADFGRALSALLPDPITAREEVTRFYAVVTALDRGQRVQAPRPGQRTPIHTSATFGRRATREGEPSRAMLVFSTLGAIFALLAAIALVYVIIDASKRERAANEAIRVESVVLPGEEATAAQPPPPEPVEEAEESEVGRPPPSTSIPSAHRAAPRPTEPPPEPPARVSINRAEPDPVEAPVEASAPPALEAPAALDEPAFLTVSSVQTAEVYIDGQFVRKVPVVRREYPAGRHVVTIVAPDGRRISFAVELEPGKELRRVWDFDLGEWRR